MLLNTLIFICGAVLIISAAITFFIWIQYRHSLIKDLLIVWCSGIVNFALQGAFNNLELSGFLAFATNSVTIIYFLRVFSNAMEITLPYSKYKILLGLSILVSAALMRSGFSYQISSALFCIACAAILTHGGLSGLKGLRSDILAHGFRFLLLFDAIHFLDYPTFRTDPNLAIVGFSITLLFFFSCSTYIPIFILRKISREYTNKLKMEVKIRTQQLHESNQQLNTAYENIQANKLQIETLLVDNRCRLSVLVHDISTPLQTLFINFGMLVMDPAKYIVNLPDRHPQIQGSINSINQILSEARNTHSEVLGKRSITLEEVKLKKVIHDLLESFELKIKEKNLLVAMDDYSLDRFHVLGNEGWLRNQVFSNLISNAIKFSPLGGEIKIFSQADQNHISIFVINAGLAIPLEKREKIFKFNENTTSLGTLGEKGTGFGLPIVKQYIEMMGGCVGVETTEDEKVCFKIDLKKSRWRKSE